MGVSKEGNQVDCPFSLNKKTDNKIGEIHQNNRRFILRVLELPGK